MEQEVAGRVVRDVDVRETVGVKLDAPRGEIRLVWGALGVLVMVLIEVFGFLFADGTREAAEAAGPTEGVSGWQGPPPEHQTADLRAALSG